MIASAPSSQVYNEHASGRLSILDSGMAQRSTSSPNYVGLYGALDRPGLQGCAKSCAVTRMLPVLLLATGGSCGWLANRGLPNDPRSHSSHVRL